MTLENQVTSLELSKKLKDLGVKQESYFFWYGGKVLRENQLTQELRRSAPPVSAFTVAELGEMLPWYLSTTDEFYLSCDRPNDTDWGVEYSRDDKGDEYKLLHMEIANTEADARAKMLICLIENNLITP